MLRSTDVIIIYIITIGDKSFRGSSSNTSDTISTDLRPSNNTSGNDIKCLIELLHKKYLFHVFFMTCLFNPDCLQAVVLTYCFDLVS